MIALVALALAQSDALPSSRLRPPTLLTPLRQLFSPNDYPNEARQNREQGTVGFILEIGPDGRVQDCRIVISSGSPSLDAKTCEVLQQRAKFRAGINSLGQPAPGSFSTTIHWAL